jgi:hypothetical protein
MLGRRGLEQSGGGGDDNDKIVYLRDDSYQRQIDYLDNIFNMTGGSKRSNYLHLFSLYNRFVAELRANNKQIEENDDAIIRQHLSLLKETEDKLNQIILYTLKYREIKDDPEFKTLVEQNPVTVNLLQQLDTEYDTKLETKRVELEGKYRDRGKKGVNMLQALLEARGSFKQDFEKIVKEGLGMI